MPKAEVNSFGVEDPDEASVASHEYDIGEAEQESSESEDGLEESADVSVNPGINTGLH